MQSCLQFDRSRYRDDFAEYALANQHIITAFFREANRIWNRGRDHYSARTIIEVLRHESALAEVGSEWKINNSFAPDLARLFQDTFPDRASLFSTRIMPNARRAA